MQKNNIIILSLLIFLTLGIVLFNYANQLTSLIAEAVAPNPGHSWSELECTTGLCVTGTNVGIGTISPAAKLTIGNNVGDLFDAWSDYQIVLYTGATPQGSYGLGIKGSTLAFNSNSSYDFDVQGSTKMTIVDSNVGIGTASPTAKLHVNGNIIASDPTAASHVATKKYVDGKTTPGVPSGAIMMFKTACPSGWTRETSLDYRYPRGASTYGGEGTVVGSLWLDMSAAIPATGATANIPYIDVIWCRKN